MRRWVCALVGVAALGAWMGCSRPTPTNPAKRQGLTEDFLAAAREDLLKSNDLAMCRNAVQQLNQYLNQQHQGARPELSAEQRDLLQKRFGLTSDEMEEIAAGNLTALDASYLEGCLLFADAAQAIVAEGATPLQQAEAAFAWAVRQVRLWDREGPPLPAQFALRRGWGTPVERALVFFGIARQLGFEGCYVALPGAAPAHPRYWVCGVLIPGPKQAEIYLFDPRLGLPLPGSKGEGPATFTQLRTQPDLLKQLYADGKEYDVNAEQTRSAELHVVAPLSALAPRLRLIEELLGTALRVKLAVDPAGLLTRFETAAAAVPEGSRPPVRVAAVATATLRNFLRKEDGGTGKTHQPVAIVPREFWPRDLEVGGPPQAIMEGFFVRVFHDFTLATRMPRDEVLRGRFIYPGKPSNPAQMLMSHERAGKDGATVAEDIATKRADAQAHMEGLDRARMPRDLLIHGRWDDATMFLVKMQEQLQGQRKRLLDPELPKRFKEWRQQIVDAHARVLLAERGEGSAELARRQRDALWVENEKTWSTVLEGRTALALLDEVGFQLALCKHERAERLQARLTVARKAGDTISPELTKDVRDAWRDAAHWWASFLAEYSERPHAAAAQRMRARAHEALGEREQAAALLAQPLKGAGSMENLARALEVRRLNEPAAKQ